MPQRQVAKQKAQKSQQHITTFWKRREFESYSSLDEAKSLIFQIAQRVLTNAF
jgi:hypothetical protein